jgi:hypothetical protein
MAGTTQHPPPQSPEIDTLDHSEEGRKRGRLRRERGRVRKVRRVKEEEEKEGRVWPKRNTLTHTSQARWWTLFSCPSERAYPSQDAMQ